MPKIVKLTNTGDAPRVVYSAIGQMVAINPGQSRNVELKEETITKLQRIQDRKGPLRIELTLDRVRPAKDDAKAVGKKDGRGEPAPAKVVEPQAKEKPAEDGAKLLTVGEVLAAAHDMPYDELLAHARRLVGADKLPVRPIKIVMLTALRQLAAKAK